MLGAIAGDIIGSRHEDKATKFKFVTTYHPTKITSANFPKHFHRAYEKSKSHPECGGWIQIYDYL
jgi:hypothetical protein